GAVHDERGAEHHHAEAAHVHGAELGELLVHDELALHIEAGAAVFLWPGGGDPAARGERLAPLLHRGALVRAAEDAFTVAGAAAALQLLRVLLLEEVTHFLSPCGLFRGVAEVHACLLSRRWAGCFGMSERSVGVEPRKR